jgi:replication fork protection complex subunit Tof1/Swi1
VKGDLLEILAQFPENGSESKLKSKRAHYCIRLLAILTSPLDEETKEDHMTNNFHRHIPYLQLAQVGYKRALLHFENTDILRTVVRVSLPAVALPRTERTITDKNMIYVVLCLIRNIALITQPQHLPSQGDENEITRSTTITILSKQGIFDFLLTIGSGSGDEFLDDIIVQLEILFYLLKGIDPKKLFMEKEQVQNSVAKEFKDLLSKEKAMLNGYKKHAPTRHNRFGTMVWLKRDETTYSTVTGQHSITNDEQTLYHMDQSKKWDKPKYRGKNVPNPDEIRDIGGRCDIDGPASKVLRSFVEDFLDSSFNPLFLALRKLIERDVNFDHHNSENLKQYFYLISWFLNAATARYDAVAKENSKNTSLASNASVQDNSYAYIAAVLDQETFVLLNRSMQIYMDEKNWQVVMSTMLAFTQILLTVQSMAESKDEEDQEIAENIQNRIFYEESTHDRVLQLLRGYTNQGFAYLDAVTACAHVFVRMLERYSKVNVDLQIRSKRKARRKQKEKPDGSGTNNADLTETAADEEQDAEQEEREIFQAASERKFDFAKFSARFMNQNCVDTFLSLLQFYKDLTAEQLKRCHRYFYRLAFKNELVVLLFRVDILLLFHRLIKGPEGLDPVVEGFKEWELLVKQIFRHCVKWISKDTEGDGWKEMCMIEMLFSKIGNTVFYMQNGYDRVVEKAAPRPPAELDFKATITKDQKVGVAVGVMLENNKADSVNWIREEVKRAANEREAWEQGEEARRQQQANDDGDEISSTQTPPGIFLQTGDSAERKLALFRDKHIRLLLTTLGYQRLGVAEDTEASWLLPTDLSSSHLKDLHTKIQQAEFDPPTFDGQSATDMTKVKGSYVPHQKPIGPFDSDNNDSDTDKDADAPVFPPNMREKRKQVDGDGDEAPKKKRRLQRRNGEDPTDSDAERRAASRREKERERNAKIKSSLFITASDDESDAERDAEFFVLEEQRRQKQKGVIRNQLLAEMSEAVKEQGKGKKKEVKARVKKVAEALGEDEDDLVDETEDEMEDDVMEVSSTARTVVSESDAPPDEPVVVADNDDDDEDEASVSKRLPTRRLRAGFVLDDSDEDE